MIVGSRVVINVGKIIMYFELYLSFVFKNNIIKIPQTHLEIYIQKHIWHLKLCHNIQNILTNIMFV